MPDRSQMPLQIPDGEKQVDPALFQSIVAAIRGQMQHGFPWRLRMDDASNYVLETQNKGGKHLKVVKSDGTTVLLDITDSTFAMRPQADFSLQVTNTYSVEIGGKLEIKRNGVLLLQLDDDGLKFSPGTHNSQASGTPIPAFYAGAIPGMYVYWDRPLAEIPPGWTHANGANGAYDFRERFPLVATSDAQLNTIGGAINHYHQYSHIHEFSFDINDNTDAAEGGVNDFDTDNPDQDASLPGHDHDFHIAYTGFTEIPEGNLQTTTAIVDGGADNHLPPYRYIHMIKCIAPLV